MPAVLVGLMATASAMGPGAAPADGHVSVAPGARTR